MRLLTAVFVIVLNLLAVNASMAQQDPQGLPALPANAMDDGAPIELSPDGPAIIKLNTDAASVIVGNPAQASAVLENPRQIILVPQQPGATKVIALDRNGNTLLSRHVLVGGNRDNFIRVNKACNKAAGQTCQAVSMYYCPDRCYETTLPQPGTAAANASGDNAKAVDNTAVPGAPSPADANNGDTGVTDPVSVDEGQ